MVGVLTFLLLIIALPLYLLWGRKRVGSTTNLLGRRQSDHLQDLWIIFLLVLALLD